MAPHPLFAVPAVWGVFSGQASAKEYSSCSSPDIHFTVTGAPTSRQEVLDALEMKIRYGSANDAANAFAQEKGYAYMRYYNVDNKIKYIRAALLLGRLDLLPYLAGVYPEDVEAVP